jgi:hypothetical protein
VTKASATETEKCKTKLGDKSANFFYIPKKGLRPMKGAAKQSCIRENALEGTPSSFFEVGNDLLNSHFII